MPETWEPVIIEAHMSLRARMFFEFFLAKKVVLKRLSNKTKKTQKYKRTMRKLQAKLDKLVWHAIV